MEREGEQIKYRGQWRERERETEWGKKINQKKTERKTFFVVEELLETWKPAQSMAARHPASKILPTKM